MSAAATALAPLADFAAADAIVFALATEPDVDIAATMQRLTRSIQALRAQGEPPACLVQIEALDAPCIEDVLDAAMMARPDAILLAGCAGGEAVQHLGAKLSVREARLGLQVGVTQIVAMVGSAALLAMGNLSASSDRLKALAWDHARLAQELGMAPDNDPDAMPGPIGLARSLTLLGARAGRLAAYDTPSELAGQALSRACARARRDGFAGKIACRTDQIPIINAAFDRR